MNLLDDASPIFLQRHVLNLQSSQRRHSAIGVQRASQRVEARRSRFGSGAYGPHGGILDGAIEWSGWGGHRVSFSLLRPPRSSPGFIDFSYLARPTDLYAPITVRFFT